MVDLHTHILFDIDDGPKAIDESLSLLNKATQSGVTTFVTTSHYYSARTPFADFVSKRNARFESLRKACVKQELPVRLLRGAEIHIDPLLLNQPDFHDLCFEGTNHALLEIQHSATQLEEALLLIDRIMSYFNVVPIIAHVERYPFCVKCTISQSFVSLDALFRSMPNASLAASLTAVLLSRHWKPAM